MNNIAHRQMVQRATKAKFRGKKTLAAKTPPLYPASAEREFQRVLNGYMALLDKAVKAHLPAMEAAYKRSMRKDARFDADQNLDKTVRAEILGISDQLEKMLEKYGLKTQVEKIAKLTKNTSVREWRKLVNKTLGVDITTDYYNGEAYVRALEEWVVNNVNMIKRIPQNALGDMQAIILDGYLQGKALSEIQHDIQNSYNVSKRYAKFLARDQLATLSSQITQMQHRDAGITKYKWSTSKDERVRPCHRALHGKVFSWDDPPEMWYPTKSRGIVYTGRRCHPGEDYNCRCVAIPVFDIDSLDIPMETKDYKVEFF